MRPMLAAAVAAFPLFFGAPAFAAGDPAAPTPMPPLPAPAAPTAASRLDPDVVICKRQEETGTRLGVHKTCHTRQEWADMAVAARNKTDKIEDVPRAPER